MLSRKKSRLITVQNVSYRWAVAPDSGYIVIIAELADDPGCRLEVSAFYEDKSVEERVEGEERHRIIKPALMCKIIEAALEKGWDPGTKGPPLAFRLASSGSDMVTLTHRTE